MKRKNLKGQNLLEFAVAMVLIILLIGAIINIWVWGNAQIVKRQQAYNDTRVEAGTAIDGYSLVWPVHSPPPLGEDKVLLDIAEEAPAETPAEDNVAAGSDAESGS